MALEANVSEEVKEQPCLQAMLFSVSKGRSQGRKGYSAFIHAMRRGSFSN
jgi:hypothetical protein